MQLEQPVREREEKTKKILNFFSVANACETDMCPYFDQTVALLKVFTACAV